MALTTAQLIAQTQAMLASPPGVPFKGSSYDVGIWNTGTPAATTSTSSQQAALQQQIANLQSQVAPLQQQLSVAQQTGLKGSDQIPQALINNPQQYLADWTASQTKVPEPDTTLTDSQVAKSDAYVKFLMDQYKESQKALQTEEANRAAVQPSWLDYLTGKNKLDVQAERTRLEQQYGAQSTAQYLAKRQADAAEVGAMQKTYNAAVAAKELQLSAERERQAPMEFITRRMDRMERDANIRLNQMSADINTRLAQMATARGDFMDAQALISQAVNDYTAQFQWQYQITKDYVEQNNANIANLKTEQRDILNMAVNYQFKTLELERTKASEIGALITDAASKGVILPANAMSMDYNDVVSLYNQSVAPVTAKQQATENALNWAQESRLATEATEKTKGTVLTDEEIRAQIRQFKKQNPEATYQDAIDAITTNEDIANKDRAMLITGELFNVSPTNWQSVIFPTSTSFFESLYK